MRAWKRVTSIVLAVMMVVFGLPLNPSALAAGGAENVDPPVPESSMRFVQTGFDPETGILTMTLEIKPQDEGETVSEGVFAFQADASTVIPVTRPSNGTERQLILGIDDAAGMVANPKVTADGEKKSVLAEYLESEDGERADLIASSFNESMGSYEADGTPKFDTSYTGYLVSSARSRKNETQMLDCYFQFRYSWGPLPKVEEDGYVHVMEFDFQCYSGWNEDGTHRPAASTEALFQNSIRLPASEEEARAICNQFTFQREDKTTVAMTMGGAGFIQKYRSEQGTITEGNAYYYFNQPQISEWRQRGLLTPREGWSKNEARPLADDGPKCWYNHINDKYIVKEFFSNCSNTFSTDVVMDPDNPGETKPVENPDFTVPDDELGSYPRYIIPTAMEELENDEKNSWTPEVYRGKGVRVPLKYYLGTVVSENSITTPEKESFSAFLNNIKWEFLLDDRTSLEDCETAPSGDGKLVKTSGGLYYRVVPATITDTKYQDSKLYGSKVQKVYYADDPEDASRDRYFMTAPLGITLDWTDTEISYTDPESKAQATQNGNAPQLHISGEAADRKNCIWNGRTSGQLFYRGIYDPNGAALQGSPITIRLYRDESVPTAVSLVTDEIGQIPNESGELADGFFVGNKQLDGSGEEAVEDRVSSGIAIHSSLFDQYGLAEEGLWNTLELRPVGKTAAAMKDKENPFQIVQVKKEAEGSESGEQTLTDEYTIKYKEGMGPNDVVPGTYQLKASYGAIEETRELYIGKAKDRLAYMATSLTSPYHSVASSEEKAEGRIITVNYQVPSRSSTGALTKVAETVNILELANQWRVPGEVTNKLSSYDIASGIRKDNGDIDWTLARQKGIALECIVEFQEGVELPQDAVDVSSIQKGNFTYSSNADENCNFTFRITASHGDEQRFVEYRFRFIRDLPTLQRIKIRQPEGVEDTTPPLILTVPTKSEGKPAALYLDVAPMDQYGSQWNWTSVKEAYNKDTGRLNPEHEDYGDWWVYPYPEGAELPQGVSLTGANGTTVEVDATAKNCTFQVYAKYARVNSGPAVITVQREPSKPDLVSEIQYNTENQILVPDKNGNAVELMPTMKVFDQYGDLMQPGSYEMRWTCTRDPNSPEAQKKIHFDTATGKITVDPCAPDCKLAVSVSVGSTHKKGSADVKVQRLPSRVDSMTITTSSAAYPRWDISGGTLYTLAATGTTQYGDDEPLDSTKMGWILEKVEFPNGTVEREKDGIITGDITLNNGKYTARSSVVLSTRGVLSFNNVTEADNVPTKLWVRAAYNGAETVGEITITKEISRANEIYLPRTSYENGIQVPTSGKTNTLSLVAYVRDQYRLVMPNASPVWSVEGALPQGVEADLKANKVIVDHTAKAGSFTLTVSYEELEPQTQIISIVQDEPLKVAAVEVNGIRGQEGMKIELPGNTGTGYADYTLRSTVRDQFDWPMSGAVKWSIPVDGLAGGVRAEFIDEGAGILRVYYTEEAWVSKNGSIRVMATSASNAAVYGEGTVTVSLQESEPAYAVPVMTDPGKNSVVEDGITKPAVPQKGSEDTKVTVEATVFDQYRKPMDGQAIIRLDQEGTGLSFQQEDGTNRGILTVKSTVTGQLVNLTAVPKENPEGKQAESTLELRLSKGQAYPFQLKLDEDNNYNVLIPQWNSSKVSDVPSEPTQETVTLYAWVVDQYNAWIELDAQRVHPVWEFVGDHTGVAFVDDKGEVLETVEGQKAVLSITNQAVGEGQKKDIQLRLHTSAQEETEDFVKTATVHLEKEKGPEETYLYIEGVHENGVADPIMRPYAADGKMVYLFQPVVYDQYGSRVENADIEIGMEKESALDQNAVVEDVYKPGEKEENGDSPIGYKIYREEVLGRTAQRDEPIRILMAEFSLETGELTVYTDSNLKYLAFTAKCEAIGVGGVKRMILPISEEALRPTSVTINRSQGDFVISGRDEAMMDSVYAVVFDQYGQAYNGKVQYAWSLHLRDKDGMLIPYDTELDHEGDIRPSTEFLVQLKPTSGSAAAITVLPESFYENKTVVLQCRIADMQDYGNLIYGYSDIKVLRPGNAGGGVFSVVFHAGEYGKLVGAAQYTVNIGECPQETPGVKTEEGYGFIGWTSDGKTVVDASTAPVFEDTVYAAVYKDITDTKFLDGYKDHTVRPGNNVTRAEFIKMLVSALGGYQPDTDYGSSFRDIKKGEWYANYIAFAKQKGIAGGYPDGTFRPNASITRAEAAKLLGEATKLTSSVMGTFTDVEAGKWYALSVEALHEAGAIGGYGDGTFRPNRHITRAEAVKIIVMVTKNALNELERRNIQQYAYCPFADVKRGHWAYAYILRAAGIA